MPTMNSSRMVDDPKTSQDQQNITSWGWQYDDRRSEGDLNKERMPNTALVIAIKSEFRIYTTKVMGWIPGQAYRETQFPITHITPARIAGLYIHGLIMVIRKELKVVLGRTPLDHTGTGTSHGPWSQ